MTEPIASSTADAAVEEAIARVEDQLSVVFNRARTVWKEAAQQIHPELNPAGYKIIATVVRLGSTNAHVLGELFEMDKSLVSRQLRVLEELGLIESRPDERDGRARVLVATPVAIERVAAVRASNQLRLKAVLREHTAADLSRFADILVDISEA